MKKWILASAALAFISAASILIVYHTVQMGLPRLETLKDYSPLLVSQVYDRNNVKVGEFFKEKRILIDYEKLQAHTIKAFLAAEDDQFFEHSGVNYLAIMRAMIANLKAGHTVQGASTITQQVAKTLLLSPEKTMLRKLNEAFLAHKMEKNLTKKEILSLYLNQIYFGEGAYGIEMAAQIYFHKHASDLTIPESAMLAGLPKAPSAYSPLINPVRAKERQVYVLKRMAEIGAITQADATKASAQFLTVYPRALLDDTPGYYMEAARQLLVQQLGEDTVLEKGIKITLAFDYEKQKAAVESLQQGLRDLDHRQGFRGAVKNLQETSDIEAFLKEQKYVYQKNHLQSRSIQPGGVYQEALKDLAVNDELQGYVDEIKKPAQVTLQTNIGKIRLTDDSAKWVMEKIRRGDVLPLRIAALANKATPITTANVAQEPLVEGAVLSFDQETQDVLAMVGGYKFSRNEFNRALQAARQTGSSFKSIVYASAFDHGFTASSTLIDSPVVFEQQEAQEGQEETKAWKPSNHGRGYGGELTVRTALVQSLNLPAVKLIEELGVPWVISYAQRLGVFSALNRDFTLALGSSSLTLYEMTKIFSQFGRLGKRTRPILVKKVEDNKGNVLAENLSLDLRFQKELGKLNEEVEQKRTEYFERKSKEATLAETAPAATPPTKKSAEKYEPQIFFQDPDQLLRPQTAFLITSLLKGVVEDPMGTGARARSLNREIAGKTGTTNGYYDAWFLGYSYQIATGVWVGFDQEKTLGKNEVGGRSALPIWLDYMKVAQEGMPKMTWPTPPGIVFANIDGDTGKLANAATKRVVRQPYLEGTEPTGKSNEDTSDFYRQEQ